MLSNPRAGGQACGGCGGAERAHSSCSPKRVCTRSHTHSHTYDWVTDPKTHPRSLHIFCSVWKRKHREIHTCTQSPTLIAHGYAQTHEAWHRTCKWRKTSAGKHVPAFPVHPLPSQHFLCASTTDTLASRSSLLPLTGGLRRGGAGREASVNKLRIHPPLPHYLSICPERDRVRKKVDKAVEIRRLLSWDLSWCPPDIFLSVDHVPFISNCTRDALVCGFRRFSALYRWLTSHGRPLDLWPLHCNSSTGEVWQLRSLRV